MPAMTPEGNERALVVGGGYAGLVAARVLADRFDEVVVLEQDDLTAAPEHRRGTPQSRHPHALLARGAELLEDLFPGLRAELRDAGAPVSDFGQFPMLYPAGWSPRVHTDLALQTFADFGKFHVTGRLAWWFWLFVHIMYLVGFRNRVAVMLQWAWSWLTFTRGARLIKDVFRRMSENGVAILMSTHTLEVAEEMCHRVSIILKGRIIAHGTVDEVRAQAGTENTHLTSVFLKLTGGSGLQEIDEIVRPLREIEPSCETR